MARQDKLVQPVVKWAGGKRQILPEIEKHIPKFSTYYEPFVGGGAVLFHLQPQRAVVNDVNKELVNLYNVIKNHIDELIADLQKHVNEEEYFYKLRELDRDAEKYNCLSPIKKASRILYLNKTCYNGLFRVNRAGEFNAPFGRYANPNIINEGVLRAVHNYLNKAKVKILNLDFAEAVKGARKGSFVYFDPPYDPVSNSANFTGYSQGGFDREGQIRLKKVCDMLNKKGIPFLLSNSSTDFIRELYREYRIEIVKAKRAINSDSEKRGEIDEVLVRNY